MSDESECTTCDGDGGWWQLEPSRTAVVYVHCEHCDGTGVEPDPGVMPTPTVEEYL